MRARIRWIRVLALAVVCCALPAGWIPRLQSQTAPAQSFARQVEQLSEAGGEFDTDNLISNERSYLHVIPALQQNRVTGGAYIGVGPDQNFSYIAHVRPSVAYIIDIRRDNLLLHLLFKALFAASRNRIEYLSLLTGRPVPDRVETWRDAGIDRIAAYLDEAKPIATSALDERLHELIRRTGVAVSSKDFATIDRFHAAFVEAGLSLQFQSSGRRPRPFYPTLRDLILETDRQGRKSSYLASEDDFQFVRALEARDGIIPVVGDLGGWHALAAIGQAIAQRGERVSAFYVSNVEMYLFREGGAPRYFENLKRLPRGEHSVVIRSVFGGYSGADSAPGYYSTSTVQDLNELLAGVSAGRYRNYDDLVTRR